MSYIQSNQVVTLPAPLLASVLNVISPADSGKILIIPVQTAIQTYTLPLPASGLSYRFQADDTLGFAVTIATNPVSLFYGNLTNVSTAAITTATVAANLGSFPIVTAIKNGSTNVAFTATAVKGDYISMYSDGVYWFVSGMSTSPFASGATAAATLLLAGLN